MSRVVTFVLILLASRSHDVHDLSLAGDKATASHVLTEYMGCEVDVGVMPRLRKDFIRFGAKDASTPARPSDKFALLQDYIARYLKELGGVQDASAAAGNSLTVALIELLSKLIGFGFFATRKELQDVVRPLVQTLDGSNDQVTGDANDGEAEGVSDSQARWQASSAGALLVCDIKRSIIDALTIINDVRDDWRMKVVLARFRMGVVSQSSASTRRRSSFLSMQSDSRIPMSTRVLKLSKDQRVEFEGREGVITSNDGAYEVLFDDQISTGRKKTPEIVPFESDISVRPSSKLLPLQVSDDFSNFFNEYVQEGSTARARPTMDVAERAYQSHVQDHEQSPEHKARGCARARQQR